MKSRLRKLILELSYKENVGHLGPHLSIIDIIWCLYDSVLNSKPTHFTGQKRENNRDRFVLSKGHAALALYVVLYEKGFITREEIDTYCSKGGSKFGVHPKININGIDFSSGSLGQGLNYAVGAALAAKIQKSDRVIYCLISDGEINEGCVWEGLMFAAHHKLNNLVIILDNNKQQALGQTKDIIEINNIEQRIKDFGLEVFNVEGHNHEKLTTLFKQIKTDIEANNIIKPIFINADTISGKGVSYMEKTIKWHYKSMSDKELKVALEDLSGDLI